MRRRYSLWARVALFAAVAMALGACALSAAGQRAAPRLMTPQPTASQPNRGDLAGQSETYLRPGTWAVASVREILTSAFPANHIPPFDKTSTSAEKAQELYGALLALPAMPSGTMYCPIDWGNVYHLRFADESGRVVATALVKPDGCETVILPDGSVRWTALSTSFWATFAAAMSAPLAAVRNPQPHQSGPSAPTSLPN